MDEKGSRQHIERRAQFARAIPDALSVGATLLYVGGKPDRLQMTDLYLKAGWQIDVLEVWTENAEALREMGEPRLSVIHGDVRTLKAVRSYDVAMWWHGPEHVTEDELPNALRRLERAAKRMVILASPWGRYAQGPAGGNPFEEHRAAVYPEALWALGYETDGIGARDRKGSNLLAWKRLA